ncbi:MAG TPA: peptide ABC transporter substrate-binding protein [Anaerolineales bacterium]
MPINLRLHQMAFIGALLLLASCGIAEPGATPTPAPPTVTPTPVGPQTLNICMSEEPSSLYLYGDNSHSARAIRQAIYDGPFELQGYIPQAVILENIPSLDNGGAALQPVTVTAGQEVVDAEGLVRNLQTGVRIYPAGCKDGNCVVEYSGGEMQMDQLVVTFTLKADLSWSDGTALTAADSVYSFELNADKTRIERTASYTASDERSVVWSGLPGYLDPGYQTNFWTPAPRHAWEGTATADLLAAEFAARKPLGWGPYVIDEWVAGERIELSRNPNYWRAAEGLPYFSNLNFIFIEGGAEELQNGTCDLLLPSAELGGQAASLQETGAQVVFTPAGNWEHLDFGIKPLSYDNGFNLLQDRADFFGDARLRQAMAMCIDRQALITDEAWGKGSLPNTYLPPGHPLADPDAASYAFDPGAANAVLDELGWVLGPDGVRVNQSYPGAQAGVAMQFTLATGDSEQDLAIAHVIQSSLDDCGVAVEVASGPAEQVFAPGPQGAVFGRAFDLAQFAWPYGQQPACYLYLSEAVPGEDLEVFKYGWGGWNLSGFANPEYDAACQAALRSLPGEAGYGDAERQAQALFAEQLPALPLFVPYEVAVARADFCGFSAEAGSELLQGLESYGYGRWCN